MRPLLCGKAGPPEIAHAARRPAARPVAQVARSESLVKAGPIPACVLARVFAADDAGVAAFVRERQSRPPR